MPQQPAKEVEHEITVHAEATEVYRLLAEVENWPRIFPPSVYVDRPEHDGNEERIRVWATANGEPKHWASRRTLDPASRRIEFRQEVSSPPVGEMSGTWITEPAGTGSTRLRLLHRYRAIDDDPAALAWIDDAVDANSRTELASLKATIESATREAERTLSFVDTVLVEGAAKDCYDFINEAGRWTERLPHVAGVRLTEETPGLQTLRMDTRTKDGSTHTTESIRVCFPDHRIAYKQTTLPALMSLHTGRWDFTEDGSGTTTASSQHTVVIDEANIAAVLGAEAGLAEAREYLRNALGGNSRATLEHAKRYAEQRR